MGVPVVVGEKSASERFAGATHTYSIEALMPDGKALQAGTSHELGQNFSRAYDISFAAEDQSQQYAWTTSWGMSWRMLGAMIMVHGDDRGLRIPPKMAPIEVVIVPIVRGDSAAPVLDAARAIFAECKRAGLRVKLDDREGQSPGFKFNEWDMRGVPLRVELGERSYPILIGSGLLDDATSFTAAPAATQARPSTPPWKNCMRSLRGQSASMT